MKDSGHLLFALALFDDAEKEPMPAMLWPDTWVQMKREIRKALRKMG